MNIIRDNDYDDANTVPNKVIETRTSTERRQIPVGYLPIQMSTRGRLNVPEVVYVRNFTTSDLLELSMISEEILPERVISTLSSLIYGNEDVGLWPENAIVELLIKIYSNYFTPMLTQIIFPWNDEDIAYLNQNKRNKEAEALEKGTWVPRIDLDLRAVNIQDLENDKKARVTIRPKVQNGEEPFEVTFLTYSRYGDSIIVKNYIEKVFESRISEFAKIKQLYEIRQRYIESGQNLNNLPIISERDMIRWQKMEMDKALLATKASQALYLERLNGEDLSKASLEEKIRKLDNIRFDIKMAKKIDENFNNFKFGINPDIEVLNPITGERCIRRFSFQIFNILSAIQKYQSDEYDISYDD